MNTYEVRYVGAPYGTDESGRIVSRHKTARAALSAMRKLQNSPKYHGNIRLYVNDGVTITRVDAPRY